MSTEPTARQHDLRMTMPPDATGTPASPVVAVLDDLKAALEATVDKEPIVLKVPGRDEVALKFNPTIDFELYRIWVKRATPRKGDDPDHLKLSLTVLAHTSAGMLFRGQERFHDGEPLLLSSPAVHGMLGVPVGSTATAIRKMYGSDGHIIQTMKLIVEAAGYSLDGDVEELGEADPLAI